MPVPSLDFLTWASEEMGRYPYDLARSGIPPPRSEEVPPEGDPLLPAHKAEQDLRERIGAQYGAGPEQVLVVAGASQGYFLLCAALLNPNDEVICETPAYEPLWKIPEVFGAEVVYWERPAHGGFGADVALLTRLLNRRTRMVVMTNPHNPSGAITTGARLREISEMAARVRAHVVVDEVYRDFLGDGAPPAAATQGGPLISLSSFTKAWGLAHARVGWAVGPEPVVRAAGRAHTMVAGALSGATLAYGLAALSRAEALQERRRRLVGDAPETVRRWLTSLSGGLRAAAPAAPGGVLFFPELPPGVAAPELTRLLVKREQTLVVPGDFFRAPGYIRISCAATGDVLPEALARVGRVVSELAQQPRTESPVAEGARATQPRAQPRTARTYARDEVP